MWLSWLVLSLWFAVSLGTSRPSSTEKRQVVSAAKHEWDKRGEADTTVSLSIHIALKQRGVDYGVESLLDLSNPSSPNFGRHWTAREVAEAFAPPAETISAVIRWLNNSGVHTSRVSPSHGRTYLVFDSTVGEAAHLLNTTFHQFEAPGGAAYARITSTAYHIPTDLASAVDYILATNKNGLTRAPSHAKRRYKSQALQPRENGTRPPATVDCDKYTAPSCLRELYRIPVGTSPHPNNSFGIYESAYVTWLPEDLDLFFKTFQPELTGRRPVVEAIDGGYLQTDIKITPFNLEPDLDFEYAIALTNPQEVKNIQVGDQFLLGNINNMLAAFDRYYCDKLDPSFDPIYPDPNPGGYNKSTDCGTLDPPKVLSISWGDSEANYAPEYLEHQCLEFLKLGLMGVTVVVGSGDDGTESGFAPGTCIDPATGASNSTTGTFSPAWPAACPWVTTVGGTQRPTQPFNITTSATAAKRAPGSTLINETAFDSMLGARRVSSGGGFSNVFLAPDYQRDAVADYTASEAEHLAKLRHVYNGRGRAFPDVAALAAAYLTALYGNITTVYGTSASAPVFASVVALLNNERMNAGKGPIGFINPVLYAHPRVLNDITTGENSGCGFDTAFRASRGWDPVTGLGSPNYEKMLGLFMSLP